MSRPRHLFGPNLSRVIDLVPPEMGRELIAAMRGADGPVVDLSGLAHDADRPALSEYLSGLDQEILEQMEAVSRQVVDLSDGKGATSLNTVVTRKMYNTDIESFEDQLDDLCRSIWVFVNFPDVFDDARSFHTARRYREHGKLYSAFEVADDVPREVTADEIDLDDLSERIRAALDLKAKTSATAIDLLETKTHPPSVMVAIRHGGALSSIQDHRDDGLRTTLYFRPANEAILIYTPSLRRLEVCATGYTVREKTSRTFAEAVLGQDLSKKPLAQWNYSLERFKKSFFLPLPDFDDVEILSAAVTEIEMRPGNWKRRVLLQVTADDDIEDFAERYMTTALAAARVSGFSRIKVVTTYRPRGAKDAKSETLALWVNSINASNVQNARDPNLRDLGTRLLAHWGVMEEQRLLRPEETSRHFESLLFLYDYPEDEVEGRILKAAGVDINRMQSAKLIARKGRQQIVLVEDDDDVIEAELETDERPADLSVTGEFGEDLGTVSASDHTVYLIDRVYLAEVVLDALRAELGARSASTETDHIASFGAVEIGEQRMPVYLVRSLASHPRPELLDLEFRRRHVGGPGLVLATGDTKIPYLGSYAVVQLRKVVTCGDEGLVLEPEALEQAWRLGQSLVTASDAPMIIRHDHSFSTLQVPGQPPFNVFGEKQAIMFERLIEASRSGVPDVRTGTLMQGMVSKSPMLLFSSTAWKEVKDHYLTQARPKSWRLGPASPDVI
ncbi:hypothetical protein C8D95_11726 [Silicimonas algicola]|uniref:Uncharacterized protein n=1 Tax=Silicimonas algicola TaxID=1826607 RepID=A0A316FTJ2_9RHOB|nr:hypothetical protein C8D95_11726 [Silicimonas algicola]